MTVRFERFTRPRLRGVHLHVAHWQAETNATARAPLVLLHGGGANLHWWDHLAPTLADQHSPVALDFRGHGHSDFPDEIRPRPFAGDLAALLEHLDGAGPVLVGHSLGALVALDHAASGGRARALVLIEPSRGSRPSRSRATRRALSMRLRYASREQAVARFRFLPGSARTEDALRRHVAEHSVMRWPDGRWGFRFDGRWFAVATHGDPELAAVHCPTLVIRGAESTLLSAEGAAEIVTGITGARGIEVPDAGHHVQMERPGAVLEAIRTFLARLPTP